ncbi:hypothetical protein BH11CYA1_BH11CYA1_04470 [soil metagenome]
MAEKTIRQVRKGAKRQQSLIDAATRLFTSKGFAGTTIDDIVEEADVAKVTFYAYFKSKEEIALTIKRQCFEECVAYTETLLAKKLTCEEMLKAIIVDIADWTEENWRLLDVFCSQRFSPLFERDDQKECKPEPLTICLQAIISQGQQQALYRKDIDTWRVAHLMDLAILCEQYHWARIGGTKEQLVANLTKCFDIALNGIVER